MITLIRTFAFILFCIFISSCKTSYSVYNEIEYSTTDDMIEESEFYEFLFDSLSQLILEEPAFAEDLDDPIEYPFLLFDSTNLSMP